MSGIGVRLYASRPGRVALAAAWTVASPLARRRFEARRTHRERADLVAEVVPGGAHQRAEEITAFLELVESRRPTRIMEIGVADGGTNVLLTRSAPSVSLVIGVDTRLRFPRLLRAVCPPTVDLRLIEGSSQSPSVVAAVVDALGDHQLDVLFIDGDHEYEGAMGDYRTYRHLVRPGGLIAFHDIIEDGRARGGPPTIAYTGDVPRVWRELKAKAERTWEFVDGPDQDGCGIGVLEAP